MKHSNPAALSQFFRRSLLFVILLSAVSLAHAQCPIPYPKGDLDSTFSFTPVSTVVTRNDITSFGSGVPLTGDSLSIYQTPVHGTVVILNDSTIIYTPYPGFVGTDFYTYTVCNSCGNCAQASVSIEVKPFCPPPSPVADVYTVYNNVSSTLAVTANDVNIAGGPTTVTIMRAPAHGIATASGSTVTYEGTNGYVGPDTLVYQVCDTCQGNNCATAYVYLNVIACIPVTAINDAATVQQGATTAIDVTDNDANASGFGTIVVTLLNGPHFGGTASLSGHTVTYQAGATGTGLDSIKYQVCTACGCDTAYAIFTVTPAPCTHPTAIADNVYAGYSSTCSNTFNVLANDIIPIGSGALTVTIVSQPLYGTATVVNNKVVYTCTDSTHVGQTDVVRYSLCNACLCDTGTVAIHITAYPCNGLNPVINKDTAYVCRNYSVTVNVTANDYDPDGGVVSVDSVVGAPQHGAAVVTNSNNVTYTPSANFSGHDFFVYQACDNGTPRLCNIATVDVFVVNCNQPPVIVNAGGHATDTLHVTVIEDSSLIYCINYTQPDSPYAYISTISLSNDTVTSVAGLGVLGTSPACVRIAPPQGYRTEQSVQVVICDKYPLCDTVLVIISIVPVNHAPVAVHDSIAYSWSGTNGKNVLHNDYDVDSADHFSVTHFDSVSVHGGTITHTSDSVLTYTADSFYVGLDTFYYTICDLAGACSTTYVVVSVPLIARPDYASTNENQSVTIPVTANDSRAVGEYITLCSVPLHGTATIDSAGVSYLPNADYPVDPLSADTSLTVGVDSFCYTLCSVSGTDTTCTSTEVHVTIAPLGRFYIPQGFSPNGDGVNDKFVIVASGEFPKSQLLVYNRYGDEVWRNDGDGYLNDFDGTWKKNQQPLPDMSYWYIFKFNDGLHADRMGYIVIER